jgi:hypothetical protein
MGRPAPPSYKHDGWDGHMVVLVNDRARRPLLIDATIGQARRPQWPELPSMIVSNTIAVADRRRYLVLGYKPLAAFSHRAQGQTISAFWVANPTNDVWKTSDWATDPSGVRSKVVAALLAAWE